MRAVQVDREQPAVTASSNPSPVEIRQSSLDELRTWLAEEPNSLFAVLDACDEPRVPDVVCRLGPRAVCLCRSKAEEEYSQIAPYLARVDEAMLDWIVENLWEAPWGIFAVASTDLAGLRTHFRRFLKVEGPDGKELLFRFYDPRVLPTFLPTCTEAEAAEFFGPVGRFCVTGEEGDLLSIERAAAAVEDQ